LIKSRIVPVIRVSAPADARFAAETIKKGGIPILEVTMTAPGAMAVLRELSADPALIAGAGMVPNAAVARSCVDAGARFIATAGLDPEIVEIAVRHDLAILPGVLTPTEAMSAWKLDPDFLKIYPCSPVGGAAYLRSLKVAFPHIEMMAAGGVTQRTAVDFVSAGAAALSLGGELLPAEAIAFRDENRILELARRFLASVRQARRASEKGPSATSAAAGLRGPAVFSRTLPVGAP
jgi:2-dehydro-3-deoxyphosphogluconate aldolase/(4S)-4-hydroxy-2-oxoglutarate aldolase